MERFRPFNWLPPRQSQEFAQKPDLAAKTELGAIADRIARYREASKLRKQDGLGRAWKPQKVVGVGVDSDPTSRVLQYAEDLALVVSSPTAGRSSIDNETRDPRVYKRRRSPLRPERKIKIVVDIGTPVAVKANFFEHTILEVPEERDVAVHPRASVQVVEKADLWVAPQRPSAQEMTRRKNF